MIGSPRDGALSRAGAAAAELSSHQYVTVSVGIAATKPDDTLLPGDLIEAAEAALYAAKHSGGNTGAYSLPCERAISEFVVP